MSHRRPARDRDGCAGTLRARWRRGSSAGVHEQGRRIELRLRTDTSSPGPACATRRNSSTAPVEVTRRLSRLGLPVHRRGESFDDCRTLRVARRDPCVRARGRHPLLPRSADRRSTCSRAQSTRPAAARRSARRPSAEHALRDRLRAHSITAVEQRPRRARQHRGNLGLIGKRVGELDRRVVGLRLPRRASSAGNGRRSLLVGDQRRIARSRRPGLSSVPIRRRFVLRRGLNVTRAVEQQVGEQQARRRAPSANRRSRRDSRGTSERPRSGPAADRDCASAW